MKITIEAQDLIAIIAVLGLMVLMALGIDSVVAASLAVIISYYFGQKTAKVIRSRREDE